MAQNLITIRKIRLLFFVAIMVTSFGCAKKSFYLFTGTYTSTGSKGIYVYKFNEGSGNVSWVSNTDGVINPSYLTVSGNYVYAVNETNGVNPGRVSAFSFNKKDGKLSFLNTQFTGGDDPCYVSATADGKWITVANYSGGSASIFPVNKDGSLQPYSQLIQHSGSSVNKNRQEKPHVHETVFSPGDDYVMMPDLGLDKVMIYKMNPSSKTPLKAASPSYVAITPGSGPRHITFSPDKKYSYLINEMSEIINAYSYNDGKFALIQEISALPQGYLGAIDGAEIVVSPDGKFLYASYRGNQNLITIFSIDANSGKLKLEGHQSTLGKAPRSFIVDPTGNYLLVANQNSDNIVIFKRDKQTGLLKATGKEIKVPKPVCLEMVPLK